MKKIIGKIVGLEDMDELCKGMKELVVDCGGKTERFLCRCQVKIGNVNEIGYQVDCTGTNRPYIVEEYENIKHLFFPFNCKNGNIFLHKDVEVIYKKNKEFGVYELVNISNV